MLVVGAVTGSGRAASADFGAFYEAHRERLFRALAMTTRDADVAAEAIDEAMTRAVERWDAVLVSFADGTTVEAPVVGTTAGYPPIAVIPVESASASGTAYAKDSSGVILSGQPFTIAEFVNPGG